MKNDVVKSIYDYLRLHDVSIDDISDIDTSFQTNPTLILGNIFKENILYCDSEIVDSVSIYKWLLLKHVELTKGEWELSKLEIVDHDKDERCGYDEIILKFNSFGDSIQLTISDIDSDYISPNFFDNLNSFSSKYLKGTFKLLETLDQTLAIIYLYGNVLDVVNSLLKSEELARALCAVGNSEYLSVVYNNLGDVPSELCQHFGVELSDKVIDQEETILEDNESIETVDDEAPDSINQRFLDHVYKGNIELTKNDLHEGADVDFMDDIYGGPPIKIAVEQNNFSIVKLLVEHGADVNKKSYYSALSLAALINKNEEITKYLLNHGANPNSYLHSASILNHACYNTDPDTEKAIPLTENDVEIVKLLLNAGADTNGNRGDCPPSPINTPIKANDLNIVQLLLSHGAKLTTMPVLVSAIYCTEQGNHEMLKLLLENGWKPTPKKAKDKYPASPLNYAVASGFIDIVKLLIEYKVNLNYVPNYCPNDMYTSSCHEIHPVSLAIKSNQYEILELLLKNAASPDGSIKRTSIYDVSPIIVAASKNDLIALDLLLQYKVDVNKYNFSIIGEFINFSNQTALDIAIGKGHSEMIKVLNENGAVRREAL